MVTSTALELLLSNRELSPLGKRRASVHVTFAPRTKAESYGSPSLSNVAPVADLGTLPSNTRGQDASCLRAEWPAALAAITMLAKMMDRMVLILRDEVA